MGETTSFEFPTQPYDSLAEISSTVAAEQIIHAHIDRANGNRVEYTMGSIEAPELNLHVINILEGTRPAFDNRGFKYLPSRDH